MNRLSLVLKQKIFNIVFVLIALLMGMFMFLYINNLKSKIPQDLDYKEAVIANAEIIKGEEINGEKIKTQQLPEVIFSEKIIKNTDVLIGKEANRNISKGEIIYKDFVEGLDSSPLFDSYIPGGHRAVSIPIKFYGNQDFIKSGVNVDIISTYFDNGSDCLLSETVLKNKEIIFISHGNENIAQAKSESEILFSENSDIGLGNSEINNMVVLTFYLRPEECEKIFLAMQKGVLNITICPNFFK
ncbi:MAG: Flp pilus assembly protein CpaB [Actinomycetota bacterium]